MAPIALLAFAAAHASQSRTTVVLHNLLHLLSNASSPLERAPRRLSELATDCSTFTFLTDLRALDPPEWCASSTARVNDPALCHSTYITRLDGTLSRCVHSTGPNACEADETIYTCTSACPTPPCAAALFGDVALTSTSGVDARTNKVFEAGENIYGPFEAGFGEAQGNQLRQLGCTEASLGYVDGGIDTATAEDLIAHQCSITLPRVEGDNYISLLDECGGHTNEYHFHQRMSCLYAESGGHSTKVGVGLDNRGLYGKWEDYSSLLLPALDACGAHFGVTPDSNGEVVYHYHTQDLSPFTIGCYGPSSTGGLVSLAECKALYSGTNGCGGADIVALTTASRGTIQYDRWCPCFDAWNSNVGDGSNQSPTTPATIPCPEATSISASAHSRPTAPAAPSSSSSNATQPRGTSRHSTATPTPVSTTSSSTAVTPPPRFTTLEPAPTSAALAAASATAAPIVSLTLTATVSAHTAAAKPTQPAHHMRRLPAIARLKGPQPTRVVQPGPRAKKQQGSLRGHVHHTVRWPHRSL
ncbi:hypothetical protein AB1Y20_014161 [Prymnesium parvum]|uniref:YHYH domain-containing protein n=1 Tax=Prymnesium parvum TaxID=97485 RepID=A0AB34ICX0_PRYPA